MAQEAADLRKERDKLLNAGMWRDALNLYEEKLLAVSDADSGEDLSGARQSIERLNAWGEFDNLVERAVSTHPENSGLLRSAARNYQSAPHAGRLVGGDFERGRQSRFGRRSMGPDVVPAAAAGAAVDTSFRDRVRAWQLLQQALAHATDDAERYEIWNTFSAWNFSGREAWKLQTLTPLDTLPEWGEPGPEGGTEGAPWGPDGPVLYAVPASWETAKNDGERWRFSLAERARLKPALAWISTKELAEFSQSQFGVETLASFAWWRQLDPESAKGLLEVETLAEDEVLAKTSDGVRRFKLPAEHHFIALYRSILDANAQAGDALTEVFLNRRQRDKAREVLELTIAKHGPGGDKHREKLLQQITGNWGRFEPAATVASGVKPVLPLMFRNATAIQLSAAPVDMDAVIADTISYLKSQPRELEWERLNPSQIAQRLISGKGSKYIGKPAASWEVKLSPREKHRDTRADLVVPVSESGAWWITGKLENGNSFYTLVWIVDSVIVQNDVGGAKQWWLADAESGAPVVGAEMEFFGYRTVYQDRQKPLQNRLDIRTRDFRRATDADGKTLLKPGDFDPEYQWLAIARKQGQASAFYGFQPFNISEPQYDNQNRDISYGIADRPLYKPGDTAHLKFYLRNVGYFDPDESRWANQTGTLTVMDGRGEEVVKIANLGTDELGAVEAKVILPATGALGTWQANFQIENRVSAYVSLRVEEYRKPEYEVKVEAPEEPVKLGDKFTATIKATYFHGAPVRNAHVEILVKRGSLGARWFPIGPWDWLYGPGSLWTGSTAEWHPGWDRWGCMPPHPPWWQPERWTPDELVLKTNLAIDSEGIARLEIDTAAAKAIHGDMDASYTIEARVVDASRREERATGSVIAARKPFEVVVWTNRGYTRAGEEVEASISAATLAGKPVIGAMGTLKLYQLSLGEDGRVEEKEIQSWLVETNEEGKVQQKFAAPDSGQYRLAASLAFKDGEAVEGATILNVHGPGRADAADWKFGPLELVSDKPTHAPGDTLKLRVNSDHTDAHVWLFLHVAGSSGRESRRIQLDGKSLEVEVPLDRRDMPNMFIEGISVHDAQVHTAVRQVLLPPVSKLIEVTLEPAKSRVKPREKSALRITLRDAEGRPVTGNAVLTIYDKSLEAITGGSNVGEIHHNFWTWKNNYYPHGSGNSLPNSPGNLLRPNAEGMQTLGRFGDQVWTKNRAFGGGASGMIMESDAMVAPMAMMARSASMEAGDAQAAPAAPAPTLVRKDFADLLKWSGSIQTDANGSAEIPLEFPDNLTTWKARVWVLTRGTQVGEGTAEIITSKELLVRLQAPRFLIERDESVFSAVVQNDHDTPKTVKVSLELEGDHLEAIVGDPRTVEIAAKSEARVDWVVKALREGEATFRMRAEAGDDGDAVERKLPVHVHGMRRQDAWSRVVEADQNAATMEIEVPEDRRPDQSKLTVRFSPSIAGAVVDAIPYLAAYPRESTEQTVNRFVPAVIAQKMLKDLDLNLAEIKAKRTNLNPQELGHPADRAAQWKQWQGNPVFDELELEKMVSRGVEKLMSMQNADGGWGWFSGHGEQSYPHTTAVVVHGLLAGRESGAEIPEVMLNSGIAWLMAYERRQTEALQLHVEREALRKEKQKVTGHGYEKPKADALDAFVRLVLGEAGRDSEPMLAFLHRDRLELPVYAKSLLGLEHHRKGDEARRDEVMLMISQFLKRDPENQTAYLDLQNRNYWWFWYGSDVEAHAWYLKLLAAVKPKDPDTRDLVKYLVNNRKHASYWDSTRDTAFAVEAIASYFKASGEDAPEMEIEVLLNGESLRKLSINRETLFTFNGTVSLTGDAVASGKHRIELRRSGKGTLYANAYLEVFTLEDRLRAAGLEVKVSRRVSKLIELEKETEVPDATGLVMTQTAERFRRELLEDGAAVASGDRIEVELILESKNDYEYLVFSDSKAAGFEALDALSGYISGGGFSAYMEPRDRTVDFFIRALPRGKHTLRYQLRAEAPGVYKALPAIAEGVYAPELRGNSEDLRMEITN
jgi:alpha-2-macroglobulin